MASLSRKTSSRNKSARSNKAASPWRTGTWLGLLVFVSVWMFIIGILVGRGTVSTGIDFTGSQAELTASLNEAAQSKKKSDQPADFNHEIASDPIKGLSESHKKMVISPPVTETKTPRTETRKSPVPESSDWKKTTATVKTIKKKQEKPTSNHNTNSSTPVKVPAPVKKEPKKESNRRFLQAAAMKDLQDAKQLVAKLRNQGFNAYVATAVIPGKGKNHRVRIGPFQNEVKARFALLQLKQAGIQGILLPK